MDVPPDKVAVVAEPLPEQPWLSIIIPVLDEAECLDQNLGYLFSQSLLSDRCEVILCDGGSNDATLEIAACYPCRVVHSRPGRALQMNHAAAQAGGEFLLFLHADSRLPDDFDGRFSAGAKWGFFNLRLSGDAWIFRIIESAINIRTRISRVAGGDQGLYFERTFFESLGGFPRIPLMEDIALSKLARHHTKPAIIPASITSSSRRWQDRGICKTVLLMWSLRLCYWLGVDPVRLYRFYYPQRG